MKVSSVSEMRILDQTAMDAFGISDELLMENAGGAVFQVIARTMEINGKRFAVICGAGNNGGDGLVIARKILSNGGFPRVYLLGNPQKFSGAARLNFEIVSRLSIPVEQVVSADQIMPDLAHSHGIVDALFGTGLVRNVDGIYRDVIHAVNRSKRPVFSVDIPSGIHGDTGEVMGCAVKADYTVTFGFPKYGNLLYPGFEHCGRLFVCHISFPPAISEHLKVSINTPVELPARNRNGHKGSFGDILFIAGASNYFGAPYYAAMSFLKAGGGYSRLASPQGITPFVANKGSEIVFVPQKETASGSIAKLNMPALMELSRKTDMVVLGPGLSLDDESQRLARQLAEEIETPLIIDGDGLTAVSKNLQVIRQRNAPTILTPHPGEMARLTNLSVPELMADRVNVLQQTAGDLRVIVILKGAHTLIGYPDERVFINMTGNSGMATAGSGDVLTGTIAAMFGLGLTINDAARMGVFVHGLSGDLAASSKGEDGMTAQDILEFLPETMKRVRSGFKDIGFFSISVI
jgi:NAD(P)H-hydrate epimerase